MIIYKLMTYIVGFLSSYLKYQFRTHNSIYEVIMYQVKSNLYAIMLSIQKSVKYKYISQEILFQVLIY